MTGALDSYTLRLRLPDLDDVPGPDQGRPVTGGQSVTSTRYHAPLTSGDRLVLAARFESYLTFRHISTGELTAADLRNLPAEAPPG